uniref:Uncharacterized protein n=1 Tax=Mycena chlorophos TaxID=658473 RepID=A0ABQ0L9W4_MYCCL|nr:predicted protein [Mycena chlorophos]
MSTALKHRRRSHSAHSASRRAPADALRTASAIKRAQPASPQKWEEVDLWRRGKRRRRNADMQDESDAMDVDRTSRSSPPPNTTFATSAAEFQLFPQKNKPQRRVDSPVREPATTDELTRLHSEAFRSLHRSLEQSNESWVSSMQMFERQRENMWSQVPDRGRRISPIHTPDDDSDEEDIQIFAGGVTPTALAPRVSSAHKASRRCSSLGGASSLDLSDDDEFLPSLAPPTSSSRSSDSLASLSHPNDTPSSKAVAALTLALANGGELDDYEALRALYSLSPDFGIGEVGEMWH